MFTRKSGTEQIADWALGVGDVDIAVAGPSARPQLLELRSSAAVHQAQALGVDAARPVQEKIAKVQERLAGRKEKRQRRAARSKDRVDRARAWRAAGVEERLLTLHWPAPVRLAAAAGFGAADFYVFARAYAYLDRSGGAANFVVGGVLGLFTFAAGVLVAHGLKTLALNRAQRSLLGDQPELADSGLVVARPQLPWTLLAGVVFGFLCVLVAVVRYEGLRTQDRHLAIALVQALVPVVAVLAELWLYNPVDRVEPQPNWVDRRLEASLAGYQRQLEAVQEKTSHLVQRLRDSYDEAKHIVSIKQDDMYLGFSPDEPRSQAGTL